MTPPHASVSVQFAEGEVTKLRREFKLVLTHPEAEGVCQQLERALKHERPFSTQVTSVYFDRAGYPLAIRAITHPKNCLKVRTKEYFPDRRAVPEPELVLEVKRERNGLTQKRRAWLLRKELAPVLAERRRSKELPQLPEGPLHPVLAVTYDRLVYQRHESWRVTVDHHVEFFAVTPELALGETPLCRKLLGASSAKEPKVIIEVKHLGEALPEWLAELGGRQSEGYSKFAQGMSRIHSQVGLVQGG